MIYYSFLKNSHTTSRKQITFDSSSIISAMKKDKKRIGEYLAIILMDENYKFSRIKDLKAEEITETYDEFLLLFQ